MEPYGLFPFLLKFISYRIKAVSIHQVHPPFLFNLVKDGLKRAHHQDEEIEFQRRKLKADHTVLQFTDHGKAGVRQSRTVKEIAKRSLKPRKYAELIASLCSYFKVKNSVELGTSLGITTAYMARNTSHKVYTYEGAESILNRAKTVWQDLGINNVESVLGDFKYTILNENKLPPNADLIFIDGHHQLEPTLAYFKHLKSISRNDTVFIFDDIHWSPDMEKAWNMIKKDEDVRLTVDLFFVGLVFLKKELTKQDYIIKY